MYSVPREQLHFGAAQMDGRFRGERHGRRPRQRLRPACHCRARVLVAEDRRVLQEPDVAAGVIAMVMRADDVLHRLTGDRLDERDDLVVIALEHVVDQQHAFVGHPDGERIRAGVQDGVETGLDGLDPQLAGGRRPLLRRTMTPVTTPTRTRAASIKALRMRGIIVGDGSRSTVWNWTSPLSATAVAAGGLRLGMVRPMAPHLLGRTAERRRSLRARQTGADGTIADVTPRDITSGRGVHSTAVEAYVVARRVVYFSNFADQRVYRLAPGQEPQAITPQGARGAMRTSRRMRHGGG